MAVPSLTTCLGLRNLCCTDASTPGPLGTLTVAYFLSGGLTLLVLLLPVSPCWSRLDCLRRILLLGSSQNQGLLHSLALSPPRLLCPL